MATIQFIQDYQAGILTIRKGALAFQHGSAHDGKVDLTLPDWKLQMTVPADVVAPVTVMGGACRFAVGAHVRARASSGVPEGTPGVVEDVQMINDNCYYRVRFSSHGIYVVTDADLE